MALARGVSKFVVGKPVINTNGIKRLIKQLGRFSSSQAAPLSVKERAEAENWRCRQDLATVYRGFEWYNLHESVCTHLTMMAPAKDGNGEVMLANSHGEHWSEVS